VIEDRSELTLLHDDPTEARPRSPKSACTGSTPGWCALPCAVPSSDGTVAVDLDPVSLLCRLAASVPSPDAPGASLGSARRCVKAAPAKATRASLKRSMHGFQVASSLLLGHLDSVYAGRRKKHDSSYIAPEADAVFR